MSDVTCFRWSRAYGARVAGLAVAVVGCLLVLAALVGFAGWSVVLLGVGVVVAVGCLVRFVSVPPVLLEVSSSGYRVRSIRGSGVPAADWSEVESVSGGTSADGAVMVVGLSGGRSTVVPLSLLGARAVVAEQDMHTRLNSAFGYRRLQQP